MTDTMVIRNADWLVAYDPVGESHVYLRNADLAFTGNTITYVGPRYQGEAAREIDGRERLVTPGLVNIHSHPSSEPLRKGITDETLSPGFHHSSLYEFLTVFDNDAEGRVACLQVALAELLLSGCTTVTDLSSPYDEWLDTLGRERHPSRGRPRFPGCAVVHAQRPRARVRMGRRGRKGGVRACPDRHRSRRSRPWCSIRWMTLPGDRPGVRRRHALREMTRFSSPVAMTGRTRRNGPQWCLMPWTTLPADRPGAPWRHAPRVRL